MLHDRFDFVRDGFCFNSVDLALVLPPMRQVDIDQRRIEPLRWFWNAQWNDRLWIKLETETDDRFDAPKVLPKHDSRAWEHSASQGIERASWQKQLRKRLLLQVVVTEL